MFIDEVTIDVRAGDGGDGCISFRREKYVPKGGPDGGDGGAGGDVVLVVDPHMRTLLPYRQHRVFAAGNGKGGMGKQMFGRGGEDAVIRVPAGTLIEEVPGGRVLADLVKAGQSVVLARGGSGGKGNVHFKSSTRRVPRIATPGRDGEELRIKLTLKLLADVGLVGLPNAGKSTLMKRISNATPKVGAFPFTTIRPNLGIVGIDDFDSFVLADLPGLIEGASQGKGLGIRFLRHVERTRTLLILIDSASPDPEKDYRVLLGELGSFRESLLRRPRVVCYSRSDLAVGRILPELDGEDPIRLSSHTGEGIQELLWRISQILGKIEGEEGRPQPPDGDPEGKEPIPVAGIEPGTVPGVSGGDEPARSFADRLDEGEDLGRMPWPRQQYVELASPQTEDG